MKYQHHSAKHRLDSSNRQRTDGSERQASQECRNVAAAYDVRRQVSDSQGSSPSQPWVIVAATERSVSASRKTQRVAQVQQKKEGRVR